MYQKDTPLKRNKLLMEDYYRKQANAMINGNTINSEGGESLSLMMEDILSFQKKGDQMQYSEMGPQMNTDAFN